MYMPAYSGNPRNPRHPVDFVDFVDIFRKSLKLLNFSRVHGLDILWIFSWMWIYPWIVLLRVHRRTLSKMETVLKSMTAVSGFGSVQPFLRKKKSLTAWIMSASSRISLSTDGDFLPRDAATPAAPFSQKR